jgi:hypothetical protein
MRTTVAVLVAAIAGEHPYVEVNANGWGAANEADAIVAI